MSTIYGKWGDTQAVGEPIKIAPLLIGQVHLDGFSDAFRHDQMRSLREVMKPVAIPPSLGPRRLVVLLALGLFIAGAAPPQKVLSVTLSDVCPGKLLFGEVSAPCSHPFTFGEREF